MKKLSLIIITLLLAGTALFSQQDAHYTQYMFNGLAINPAYAGSRGTIAATLIGRKQWLGLPGSPTTASFSFHLPTRNSRSGFGISFTQDMLGYTSQQWLNASYAFRIKAGPGTLSLGLQGGMLNYRINWTKAEVVDAVDAAIPTNIQSILSPNVGSGIYYDTDVFYVGFSVPHILNWRLNQANTGTPDFARLYRHYFLTGGVLINRNKDIKFKPSVLLKYVNGAPLEADINLSVLFYNRVWGGVSWRSFDSIDLMAVVLITPQIRFGYSYDFTTTVLRRFNTGSHEIMLGYEFLYKKRKMRSPRYF